jgi:hypothetical protein
MGHVPQEQSIAEVPSTVRWSRFVYCAVAVAITSALITLGASLWLTIPLGLFSVWWTFTCTLALWHLAGFLLAAWRLNQAPSMTLLRTVKRWERLSDPRLDGLLNLLTFTAVLTYPAVLWLPLIFWLAS